MLVFSGNNLVPTKNIDTGAQWVEVTILEVSRLGIACEKTSASGYTYNNFQAMVEKVRKRCGIGHSVDSGKLMDYCMYIH